MKRLLILLTTLCIGITAFAQNYKFDKEIRYRPEGPGLERCVLDVGYQSGVCNKPVIVWFHGGGLTGGDKQVPAELCKSGYVVIGVRYRLSPAAEIADIIDDAAAAVAWAFNNASRYGGSNKKIYIAGHSAGGYLVDMIGLDKKYLAKYGIDADDLAAIVPYSGQVITHFAERSLQGIDALDPTIGELAPLAHMRADCPPMLIISADREMELYGRYEETAYFARMMKLKGHKDITFLELDGYDHGDMYLPGHFLLLKYIREREKTRK